ncbi:hypothetical protein EDB89DRAFT_1908450 [Lactarius sanguifluus]|nr:hypothetical protein EDB89DRAFT_1908450 [Lactarius sanguifluus]
MDDSKSVGYYYLRQLEQVTGAHWHATPSEGLREEGYEDASPLVVVPIPYPTVTVMINVMIPTAGDGLQLPVAKSHMRSIGPMYLQVEETSFKNQSAFQEKKYFSLAELKMLRLLREWTHAQDLEL